MKTDKTMPEGAWEFDQDVTDAFDDMLTRSIPDIDEMRRGVSALAAYYLPANGTVLDIGCSRGSAIAHLLELAPRHLCNWCGSVRAHVGRCQGAISRER